jgi:hypothetical protein
MLIKTMDKVLSKKVNEWLETIADDGLRKVINDNLVITGGCFASMIDNVAPKDFDCYFKTKAAALRVADYYVKLWNDNHKDMQPVTVVDGDTDTEKSHKYRVAPGRIKLIFKSAGIVGDASAVNASEDLGADNITELDEMAADEIIEKEEKKYFPVFISTNAITLSNGVQIVVRFYGEPEKIHETYDFQHTKAYWTRETGTIIPNEVYDAVINKTLIYTGSKYPVCSVFRLRKFIARGWKINAGQVLKMCMQVSQLDLTNIDVLEDQLIGVDSLYFMHLIERFRKMQEKDSNFVLTSTYIMSIVDKIF